MTAASGTRQKVFSLFKLLHRTSQKVFNEDTVAVAAAREKIGTEFRKHSDVQDQQKIDELLQVGYDAETALRELVVQAKLNDKSGRYVAKVTKDTKLYDNTIFDPCAELPKPTRRRKKCDET